MLEGLKIPDLIEPMQGYRAWRFKQDEPYLYSLRSPRHDFVDIAWPVGQPLVARCVDPFYGTMVKRHYTSPYPDCSCGIYALKQPPRLSHINQEIHPIGNDTDVMIGICLLWGDVEEYEEGYRAGYAKPIALVRRPHSGRLTIKAAEIADYYGIEILDSLD